MRTAAIASLALSLTLLLPARVFGVRQIVDTLQHQLSGPAETVDFLNYYVAGRIFVSAPGHLYEPALERQIQQELTAGAALDLPFWNVPYVALVFAPLSMLPFGLAYAVWMLLNVLLLVAAAYFLAPRLGGSRSWLGWLALALAYLPLQLALVMGQWSPLVLCGLCWWAARLGGARARGLPAEVGALACLAKLQVAWAPSVVAVLERRWRGVLLIAAAAACLGLGVVARTGWEIVPRYLAFAREANQALLERRYLPGQTLLGLAESLVGPRPGLAPLLAIGPLVGLALLAWLWRTTDARDRRLVLALVPLLAVVTANRSGAYELTLWLASMWLIVDHAAGAPSSRWLALGVCIVLWWAGDVAVLTEASGAVEWGACGGLVAVAGLAALARRAPSPTSPTHSHPQG